MPFQRCVRVPDGPHKLFVGQLPNTLNYEQVKNLLLAFGELSGYHLVSDSATGKGKGYCFVEYKDHDNTEKAIAGLNGMKLGERTLVCQRSVTGGGGGPAASSSSGPVSNAQAAACVIMSVPLQNILRNLKVCIFASFPRVLC